MPDPSGNVKSQNGGIAIERPGAGEGFVLRVRYVRAAPLGHPHVVTAEVSCTDDRLATPRTWRVTKDTTGADGAHLRTTPKAMRKLAWAMPALAQAQVRPQTLVIQ